MARWRKRRDERRAPAPYVNEIKNQCPLAPNYAWVGDFTYLPFKGKFLYLATFMDLYTREIVGYHISRRHDKNLVMQAFLDGVTTRGFTKPKYLHTDQGAEYTSGDYSKLAESLGVQISMSKKASPWENGYQESFYNNFKTDLGLEFDRFTDEGHFLEEIHHTLYKYNHKRLHTSLNMPPSQFHANYIHSVSQKRGAWQDRNETLFGFTFPLIVSTMYARVPIAPINVPTITQFWFSIFLSFEQLPNYSES